jgi:hypothetical protein
MVSNEQGPESYELSHEWNDDYRLVPATGVYGGYQPQGNFKIEFTVDHNQRTKKETYQSTDDGVASQVSEKEEDHLVREHKVGVTMAPDHAYSAGCWLIAETIGEGVTREDVNTAISDLVDEDSEKTKL